MFNSPVAGVRIDGGADLPFGDSKVELMQRQPPTGSAAAHKIWASALASAARADINKDGDFHLSSPATCVKVYSAINDLEPDQSFLYLQS